MVASIWVRGALQCLHKTPRTFHTFSRLFSQYSRNGGHLRLRCSSLQGLALSRGCFHPGVTNIARDTIKATAQKEQTTKDLFKSMLAYVWPKGNAAVKVRVVVALSLLVGAKMANISVPFMFKHAIDALNTLTGETMNLSDPQHTVATFAFALIVGYARFVANLRTVDFLAYFLRISSQK